MRSINFLLTYLLTTAVADRQTFQFSCKQLRKFIVPMQLTAYWVFTIPTLCESVFLFIFVIS